MVYICANTEVKVFVIPLLLFSIYTNLKQVILLIYKRVYEYILPVYGNFTNVSLTLLVLLLDFFDTIV